MEHFGFARERKPGYQHRDRESDAGQHADRGNVGQVHSVAQAQAGVARQNSDRPPDADQLAQRQCDCDGNSDWVG